MLSFNATQQAIIASLSKKILWLLEVDTNGDGIPEYRWSSENVNWGGTLVPTQRGSVLTASDAAALDLFGTSVALSGNGTILAIGSYGWEGTYSSQGGVYIYDWSGSAWVWRGSVLTASDPGAFDQFGTSVALSSDGAILAVGANGWDDAYSNQGGVYIYDWNGSAWVQRGSVLTASDPAASDRFGSSVALSSDGAILAVGADGWEGTYSSQGGVYIYDWNGSAWVWRGSVLTAADAAISDDFGSSVALSSDGAILAVGADGWEGTYSSQGGVYIYDWSGSAWVWRGSVLTASDPAIDDYFGVAVALSSDGAILAVGASTWEDIITNQGGVYIYDWSGSAWVQRGSVLTAADAAINDYFGVAVALSSDGTILAVGANSKEVDYDAQGGVYIYDLLGDLWSGKITGFNSTGSIKASPESGISPITLTKASPESGIIPTSKVTINISNKDNVISPSTLEGANITIRLIMQAGSYTMTEILAFGFKVIAASSILQMISLECEDFLTGYLRGDYPNTRLVSDLFPYPSAKQDNVCVPLAFGTPYFPLRWIPKNTTATFVDADTFTVVGDQTALFAAGQFLMAYCGVDGAKAGYVLNSSYSAVTTVNLTAVSVDLTSNLTHVQTDHYLLGSSSPAYTILEARSPSEFGSKTTYTVAGGYTFKQDIVAGFDEVNYKVVQLIDNDSNLFSLDGQESRFDTPFRFSRSDLSGKTNPADIVDYIIKDFGIATTRIDATSQAAAAAIYTANGLALNVGLYFQQSREKILSKLMALGGMILIVRDKVYYRVLTKTSRATFTKANILPGTFSLQKKVYTQDQKDSAYLLWSALGEPQDTPNKALISLKTGTAKPADDIIEAEWVNGSSEAKKASKLALQKELLSAKEFSFKTFLFSIGLEPGDMITINDADLGGTYNAVIDQIVYNPKGILNFMGTVFSASLDDWGDLSETDITVYDTNTEKGYSSVLQGPTGSTAGIKPNMITGAVLIGDDGQFKTNLNPATNGGMLITNTSMTGYNTSGAIRFQAIYSGADQGNVTIGDYAGAQGIQWDQSDGKLDIKGRFTAVEGTIGGFTLAATKFSATGLEFDSSNIWVKVFNGSNYVTISPSGIIGHDSVLGDTFKLLTNGAAPEFSSGIIKECQYEIYTAGTIKTNADPATNGGFLLDSAKLVGYVPGAERFRIDLTGANAGDVTIGNFASNTGLQWDQSLGTFTVRGSLCADDITSGLLTARTVQTSGTQLTQATVGGDAEIYVADTTNFSSGYGYIYDTSVDYFTYAGKTSTTLTGCTGVGVHSSGLAVGGDFKRVIVSALNNEMHFFGDRGDGTVEQLASIGIRSDGGDYVVGLFGSASDGCTRIGVAGQSYANKGVSGASAIHYGVYGQSGTSYGVFGYSSSGYGGRFSVSPSTGKAPLYLYPSTVSSAPSGSADIGACWITSAGIPYHNMGTTTWYETVLASLKGTFVWDPASMAFLGGTAIDVDVVGAALGDAVIVFPPYDCQLVLITGYVKETDKITVIMYNVSGGTVDFGSGTWKYKIIKY